MVETEKLAKRQYREKEGERNLGDRIRGGKTENERKRYKMRVRGGGWNRMEQTGTWRLE